MKKLKIVLSLTLSILLCAVFCLPAFAAQEENLITNPGFEADGLGTWQKEGCNLIQSPVLTDPSVPHSGSRCAAVISNAETTQCSIYQDIAIPESGEYQLKAYIKRPESNTSRIFLSAGGKTQDLSMSQGSWQEVSLLFHAQKNTTQRISIQMQGTDLKLFHIDDISLSYIPSKTLLENGSFEKGLESWNQLGAPCAFTSTAQAWNGENSAFFSYFTSEAMNNGIAQTISATAGTYQFSAYFKTDATLSGVGAVLFLEALDASGNMLLSAASPAVSSSGGEWKQTSVTLKAPANTAKIRAKIGGIYCTGAFYADGANLISQP